MNNNKQKKTEVKNICPNCKSKKIVKWTKRKTENRGLIQRYKCKNCNKTFTIDNGRTLCEDCHRKTDTFGGKFLSKLNPELLEVE